MTLFQREIIQAKGKSWHLFIKEEVVWVLIFKPKIDPELFSLQKELPLIYLLDDQVFNQKRKLYPLEKILREATTSYFLHRGKENFIYDQWEIFSTKKRETLGPKIRTSLELILREGDYRELIQAPFLQRKKLKMILKGDLLDRLRNSPIDKLPVYQSPMI